VVILQINLNVDNKVKRINNKTMTKETKQYQIIQTYQRIHNKFALIEKMPRDFGTGDRLHPSEIHTVEAIGNNSSINVTGLAQVMGITKAAVSQIIRKLERKGFVEKFKANGNEKEVLLRLTKKGKTAFKGHELFHADMDENMVKMLKQMTDKEHSIVKTMLDGLDAYTSRLIRERE
jgi:DNA-binding MarR family transcriptional regulator